MSRSDTVEGPARDAYLGPASMSRTVVSGAPSAIRRAATGPLVPPAGRTRELDLPLKSTQASSPPTTRVRRAWGNTVSVRPALRRSSKGVRTYVVVLNNIRIRWCRHDSDAVDVNADDSPSRL